VLAKVLAFVNVTEVVRGKLPDMAGEGFAYNSLTAKGDIQEGKILLKETVLDGKSARVACEGHINFIKKELDLKFLVAPLKTVDWVVRHIPLVSHILGGTLVSIPVRVTGDWKDPTVTPLSPTAVGSGLLGIMERTVKLPVTVIEAAAGAANGSKDKEEKKEKKDEEGDVKRGGQEEVQAEEGAR
jgi:hypothetical protein